MTRRSLLAAAFFQSPLQDWRELLARSVKHDEDNFQLLRSYVFEVYDLSRGIRNHRESQTYEVNLVGPGMYFRKLKHNDRPLAEEDAKSEQARLKAHLQQGTRSDAQAPWILERRALEQWVNTHQFQYKGTRKMDHRGAVVIESKPPSGASEPLAFLTHAKCRLTLDEETGHWMEAICEFQKQTEYRLNQLLLGRLTLPYSPGLINRGDVDAGSTLTFRLQRLESGLWAPKYYRLERPGVLSELTFSKFRKFTSESQLLTDSQ